MFKCRDLLSRDGRLVLHEYTGPCYALPDEICRPLIERLLACIDPSFKGPGGDSYPMIQGASSKSRACFGSAAPSCTGFTRRCSTKMMNSRDPAPATIMRLLLASEDILMERG